MGVTGLWQVIQPCARPTNLATLNRQRLAVDASIWIYQFLKAMRDKDGNAMPNGHIVGFFRRICKLLFYGVQPVFVFDGGAPILKRMTIQGRRKRREGRREDVARTAGQLLSVQMQRLAEEEEERRKRKKVANTTGTEDSFTPERRSDLQEEPFPDVNQMVYVDEIGLAQRERMQNRRFQKQDAYHLPDLPGGIESMGRPEDPRIMTVEELEEYARQFNSGEDINLYDFSKIDFDGEFFKSLPPADRYNILNAARLRSRLRLGVSKEQLDGMFPDRMAFSRFQIERVKERNRLTQRLMFEVGMTGTDLTLGVAGGRIAGDKDREYILVKNDGAEGGWALGVVSKNKDIGKSHQPIDVDALDKINVQFQKKQGAEDSSDEDEEFEDVPVEGVNRLPKSQHGWNPTDYMSEQAKAMGASIQELYGLVDEDDSLFVEDTSNATGNRIEGQRDEPLHPDEQNCLDRAIAMSLESQHGIGEESMPLEPIPLWVQKAAPAPKPISSTTNGSIIAHIVNNRALSEMNVVTGAAQKVAPNEEDDDDSSDSDIDFGVALAADAKNKKSQMLADPVEPLVSSSSLGSLPFESMDWRKSVFTLADEQISAEKQHSLAETPNKPETSVFDVDSDEDEMAGGFVRPKGPSATRTGDGLDAEVSLSLADDRPDEPLPLPPWLTGNADIREGVKALRAAQVQQVAEHDAYLEQQTGAYQRQRVNETAHIQSSDGDDSDIQIIDGFPLVSKKCPESTTEVEAVGRDVESLSVHQQPTRVTGDPLAPESDISVAEKVMAIVASTTGIQETSDNSNKTQALDEDEDIEFEDVEIPPPEIVAPPVTEHEQSPDIFAQPGAQTTNPSGNNDEEDIFAGIDAPPEVDAYSDPEGDDLLIQLAEEAEAHATFTSALNHKPTGSVNRPSLNEQIASLQAEKQKQQRDSDEVTQVMITEVQSLLRLFGIPYITAPMEAEAQCAELVRLDLVDGIVTDDSDTFLFGGTRVYKNMFNGNKFVECYLAADLGQELSLSRTQLISLAQLLGSDYTEGLPGVGPVTAVELLAEFPGPDNLIQFRDWWAEIQAAGRLSEADSKNKFKKKFRRTLGKKLFLPPGFPSSAVEEAYMKPEVDASPEKFVWGVPDLDGLRGFLMGTVGWGPEQTNEVLVPVIKDMNKRAAEGTQSNITRFFTIAPGSNEMADHGAGGEVFAPRQKAKTSKRMTEAMSRLRARKDISVSVAEDTDSTSLSAPKRKRKARRAAVDAEEDCNPDEEYQGDGDEDGIEDARSFLSHRKGTSKKRAKASY